ncbi:MAG: sulfotransferase domain-containing protein [Desulfobacteraceae bacterium]
MYNIIGKIGRKIVSKIFLDRNNDYGATVFLSGVGRSGTTWVSNIINYKNEYRYIFEPFVAARVEEASIFEYHQYIRPASSDPKFLNAATKILCGSLKRNWWVDSANSKIFVTKRLIKDIRTNLMLKWINTNFPSIPIILLLRHPCAVTNSWLCLNWGKEALGTRTDLEICLSQQELIEDFLGPFKKTIIGTENDFEKHILLWCILNYVPLKQFKEGQIHLAFYEEFCEKPMSEINRLFSFLNKDIDRSVIKNLSKPSLQSRKDSEIFSGKKVIDGWRKNISREQIKRAVNILSLFGLDSIYSKDSMPNIDNAYKILKSN